MPVCVVSRKNKMDLPLEQGLYDPANEHDACGVGMVAHIKGEKSHAIIAQALDVRVIVVVEN